MLPPFIKCAASMSFLAIFKTSSDSKVQELQRDKRSRTSMRGRTNKWKREHRVAMIIYDKAFCTLKGDEVKSGRGISLFAPPPVRYK